MTAQPLLVVVLAAGKGVRMRSSTPKVMHTFAGRSMLAHVLANALTAGADKLALVVAPGMEAVRSEAMKAAPGIEIFEQATQGGTAHATLAARPALERHQGDLIVLFADTPLVEPATLRRLIAALDGGAHIAALGFRPADAAGYGRLVLDAKGRVQAIREHNDASEEERRIGLCNAGAMAFRVPKLAELLSRIGTGNAKGEYYLTDAVEIAAAGGLITTPVECAQQEAVGINSREQLAAAEAAFQARARRSAMEAGATLVAPETVWLSFDTALGRDVTIEPNVFFGPGVVVEDGAHIMANCHIVGARIGKGARVGPFARFRPGADIGDSARVGNFVEVKNARLETGAKANHLRRQGGRGRQHRRRHDLLQLRRLQQALHRRRQGRLRRLQHVPGGPSEDRRRRLHRLGQRHQQGRGAGCSGAGALSPGAAPWLGGEVPGPDGQAQEISLRIN
jgi:bifunctional UDP-N-acetylglucosamine pyrophosphorylase/glucosamine-1-phosphate N-acetyltransferase